MNYRLFFGLLAVSILFSPIFVSAQAIDILKSYRVAMPKIEPLESADFEAKSFVHEVGLDDEAKDVLGFRIRVPKGWKSTVDPQQEVGVLSNKIIGDLARFYSPGRYHARSSISVEAIALQYEMSSEDWVLQYLLSRGLTSKGMKSFGRDHTEFFFIDVDRDSTFAVRAVARRNGKNILFARFSMPMESAKIETRLQASVVHSFEVLYPVKEIVEPMIEYRFLDIASVYHPESWVLKAPPVRTVDQMKVQILNFNKNSLQDRRRLSLDGKIEANLSYYFSVKDLGAEKQRVKDEVIIDGFVETGALDVSEYSLEKHLVTRVPGMEAYELVVSNVENVSGKLLKYEFWMTTIEVGEYYYFFTLLTPARGEDFFTWSRNRETYDLIISSLRSHSDSIIYEE